MREPFRFKQFSVTDEKSAMKVGTDSVILGCWVKPARATRILDIGSGCGILALMMAQQSDAQIEAVEIDEISAVEAVGNYRRSIWSNRILQHQLSFQQFVGSGPGSFDILVSNPPFFQNSLKAPDNRRSASRHTDSLPTSDLMKGAGEILDKNGRFYLIFPAGQENYILQEAENVGFVLHEKLIVIPRPAMEPVRICFAFGFQKQVCKEDTLLIRLATGEYSREYYQFTHEFYLWESSPYS